MRDLQSEGSSSGSCNDPSNCGGNRINSNASDHGSQIEDIRTALTLPAIIWKYGTQEWY